MNTLTIPGYFKNIKRLRRLNLDDNKLGLFSSGLDNIAEIISLEELSLKSNGIKELPDTIKNLTKLRIIDLDDNLLDKDLNNSLSILNEIRTLEAISFRKNNQEGV